MDIMCGEAGCGRRVKARGLCASHYFAVPLADRVWDYVDKSESGCWLWRRAVSSQGYGRLVVDGKGVGAHRFFYELCVGPIPDGLHVDHLCRVRLCVNPAHLEPVTAAENNRRAARGSAKVVVTPDSEAALARALAAQAAADAARAEVARQVALRGDAVRDLRGFGWSWQQIAEGLGVTATAVVKAASRHC